MSLPCQNWSAEAAAVAARHTRTASLAACAVLLLPVAGAGATPVRDAVGCDPWVTFQSPYGMHDYADANQRKQYLPVVERIHFSHNVEALIKGDTNENPYADLSYVTGIFPNHHRALAAMVRYALQGRPYPPGTYRIECQFERAFTHFPNDAQVHLIYGEYLLKSGALDDATRLYEAHAKLVRTSPERDYHLGLIYFHKGDYPRARQYAEKAYRYHYPRSELRDLLKASGQWTR